MNNIIFTQAGFDELKKEKELLQIQRKDAVVDLKKAREMGDLSENGYYKAAKFKLSSIDRRIRMVNMLLKNTTVAQVVAKDTVDIGAHVTIRDGAETKTYLMVGGYESNPLEGKLSILSPIGRAMQGKKKGDTIMIKAPQGEKTITIVHLSYTS